MSDYPLFIPEFMLYTKSSLLWFKITNEPREFRNYLCQFKKAAHVDTPLLKIVAGYVFT